ncbi:16S rRNA (cytosine(1402)-N(4))-methyltransferase RsmH [Leadbettera azotonutricia]|uniref:Ribosomal RNA small subunit methyltransferase H n=1 Tax=Leadbettera azotonutricia (strain ATCC BAA-888 / DSM 13862 / ZAS-9) TaxID=545695 RepID=F5Y8X5_LEAAZ|nr:16S rRNA (cytosine(1402)-N(4))-methyltransferase RsmH [Leadbettera azotonutricia]AEF80113.1 S-adenosyl-methyltransferase MraW [Leadbettera azotonutricia ZAS-9]
MEAVHTPVLLEETVQYLGPRKDGELLVDASQGEGGHSLEFLSRFPELRVIGLDADPAIQEIARERLKGFGDRVQLYNCWSHAFFAEYPSELKRPDTILIDLGVSLFHYEKGGRGFSFRYDEPLDMRIDTSTGLSAGELVSRLSEKDLADLLYKNAEERYSRRIAKAIAEAKAGGAIASSAVLSEIVERAVPPAYRHGPVHPATKTFQALRIAVNGELSKLPDLLEGALRVLEPGGRLGVISFHSLEDRIVKNFFREKNKDCICPPEEPICRCGGQRVVTLLSRKGIPPREEEIRMNPPSRSARLRVAEKILDEV